jgi:peptidoglycan/LPS O-acetylase OafA/YrhL
VAIAMRRPFERYEPVAAFFYMGDYYHALRRPTEGIMWITWSLGVEEKFYLLWPALFVGLRGQWDRLLKYCLGGIGLIWLEKVVLTHLVHAPHHYFEYAFDTRADVVLVGCALALATRLPRAQALFRAVSRRPWWAIPTAALAVATAVAAHPGDHAHAPVYFTYVMPIQMLALATLFVQLITWSESPVIRLLSSRPARVLGDLSYGIYLYHFPLLWLIRSHLMGRVRYSVYIALDLAVPLVVAYLSFRLLERPFLRLKSRFSAMPVRLPP